MVPPLSSGDNTLCALAIHSFSSAFLYTALAPFIPHILYAFSSSSLTSRHPLSLLRLFPKMLCKQEAISTFPRINNRLGLTVIFLLLLIHYIKAPLGGNTPPPITNIVMVTQTPSGVCSVFCDFVLVDYRCLRTIFL